MTKNVRALAAKIIHQITSHGRSLSDLLSEFSSNLKDPRDQALLQALCYGVCREYFRLDSLGKKMLAKPLKDKDQDVYALILVGLYQLTSMRVPQYAAVTETVAGAQQLKKIWAKGLINGILRQYLREPQPLANMPDCPVWIIEKLKKHYPNKWEKIILASNQHPPLSLRVNLQKISREKYLEKLSSAGIIAHVIPESDSGIILENPMDVELLPGFSMGEVSVQDGAAQLAGLLLQLAPHQRVLDACAAPGGKTTHMLEIEPTLECVAVDHDEQRMQIVRENLKRLNFSANCIVADVADTGKWWEGNSFDRILVDAPCSASGVIRRHPDIKLLRREADISELTKIQLKLITALWPLLKKGGLLLYATCSIFPEENTQIIEKFLVNHPDAVEEKITSSWGKVCAVGKQILPGMHNMDGFYFACLRK